MRTLEGVFAGIAEVVDHQALAAATAPAARRQTWQQVLGADTIGTTLTEHARAVGAPQDQGGTLVVGQIVAGLAKVQAWSLTLEGCVLDVAPEELGLFVDGGRVLPAVDLQAARLLDAAQGGSATRAVDAAIEAAVACAAEAGMRVPARVVASEAFFAWYAVLRQLSTHLAPLTPAEVLKQQWRSRWSYASLARPIDVSPDRTYLARAVCCLEYRCDPPEARSYCTSCPMVDPDLVRQRLAGGGPVSGGRRPFGADALGRTRPGGAPKRAPRLYSDTSTRPE